MAEFNLFSCIVRWLVKQKKGYISSWVNQRLTTVQGLVGDIFSKTMRYPNAKQTNPNLEFYVTRADGQIQPTELLRYLMTPPSVLLKISRYFHRFQLVTFMCRYCLRACVIDTASYRPAPMLKSSPFFLGSPVGKVTHLIMLPSNLPIYNRQRLQVVSPIR